MGKWKKASSATVTLCCEINSVWTHAVLFETVMCGVTEMEHVRCVTPQLTVEENILYLTPLLSMKKIAITLLMFSSIIHKIKRNRPGVSLENMSTSGRKGEKQHDHVIMAQFITWWVSIKLKATLRWTWDRSMQIFLFYYEYQITTSSIKKSMQNLEKCFSFEVCKRTKRSFL